MRELCANQRPWQFWVVICVVLPAVFILQLTSSIQESQTHDEGVHIAAGYSYWKTGDFRLNAEHPPLSKLIAAIPLLWLQPIFSPPPEAWQSSDEFTIGKTFLYNNRLSADTLLLATRTVTMLLSLALSLSIAWWVAGRAGPTAGVMSVLLFAFEPSVIAHSRYVTPDLPVTLFIWLACISWYSYLERPSGWALTRTGLLTGLAVATKFNALFLYLVFVLTWLVYRPQPAGPTRIARDSLAALLMLPLLVVLLAYAFDTRAIADDPALSSRLERVYPDDGSMRSRIVQTALHTPVPGYYFLRGLQVLIRHGQSGHLSYLMGSISSHGSWKYFPIAILVKSPVAWLLLILAAIAITAERQARHVIGPKQRPQLIGLLIPIIVYFGLSMASSINIGIRHLLPIYPFICAFTATALSNNSLTTRMRALVAGLVFLFLVESIAAYPRYVSFFNLIVGADNGHKFLLDSNLDWGQDLKRLKSWVQMHDSQPLCLAYFGTADPAYYGIQHVPLGPVRTKDEMAALNCVVAMSVEYLFGNEQRVFGALQSIKPTDHAGDSIYLYDLRRNR